MYNIRGLKNYHKLKRFLNKCHVIIQKNGSTVICVQESHLKLDDCDMLNAMWKYDYTMSPSINASAGCITLYNKAEIGELVSNTNNSGRYNIDLFYKENKYTIIANIHAPNNHDIEYFKLFYGKIHDITDNIQVDNIILAGDWNLTPDKADYNNRIITNTEKRIVEYINTQNNQLMLIDSYRQIHKTGGFTWHRNKTSSRLDIIYISSHLKQNSNSGLGAGLL